MKVRTFDIGLDEDLAAGALDHGHDIEGDLGGAANLPKLIRLIRHHELSWPETRCSGMLDPIDIDFKKQFFVRSHLLQE